jgi:hypothetical protein
MADGALRAGQSAEVNPKLVERYPQEDADDCPVNEGWGSVR